MRRGADWFKVSGVIIEAFRISPVEGEEDFDLVRTIFAAPTLLRVLRG
jgi:hypothetical protein